MPVDLHILLTSRNLYETVDTFLKARLRSNFLAGTLDGRAHLYIHWMQDVPSGASIAALRNALGESAEFVFLDDDYFRLRDFEALHIKTAWFNRGGELARDHYPLQDADILQLEEMVHLVESLHKPRLAECLAWWEDWEVPENIRQHSETVARGAYVLAVMMRNEGIAVDPILTHRGGVLHDIDKIKTLSSGVHGGMGADFLQTQGYPELADIVRNHIMSTILEPDADERRWEDKLVYFCDKLVEDDQIVPFNERLEALKIRYPHYVNSMERAEPSIWALNDAVCSILSLPGHEALISLLRELQI